MGLFNRVKNIFVAKSNATVEKLEDKNAVELGKLDIQKMEEDVNSVITNLGAIKGRIKTLDREISEHKTEVSDLEAKAEALLKAGKEDLAGQVCAKIDLLTKEIETSTVIKKQQEDLCVKHEKNRDTLQQKLETAKSNLSMLSSLDAVEKSNKNLIQINPEGAESALQNFEKRLEKKKQALEQSEATLEVQEASSPDSLDKKIDEALGKKPGGDTLARLKAKVK
jgi:phage shock protein A